MKLEVEEYFELAKDCEIVDVRTPNEYLKGHIPGAHNIPLFSNEERADVGTIFKNSGKEDAVLRGLDYVGPNMSKLVRKARKISTNKKLLLYCWRGGMRSSSMAWLFETVGIETHILDGGYKAYRRNNREQYLKDFDLVVLGGMTGSGKTDVLKEMQKMGRQMIDLEGIANHKGSAFGAMGQLPQPTTEQFENNLALEWGKMDQSKPIWIENESRMIGRVNIPEELFSKMKSATIVEIVIPKIERVNRLVREYGCFKHSELEDSLMKIQKRLGSENKTMALEALEKDDLFTVADIMLKYYDKTYKHSLLKGDNDRIHYMEVEKDSPKSTAEKAIDFYKNLK